MQTSKRYIHTALKSTDESRAQYCPEPVEGVQTAKVQIVEKKNHW